MTLVTCHSTRYVAVADSSNSSRQSPNCCTRAPAGENYRDGHVVNSAAIARQTANVRIGSVSLDVFAGESEIRNRSERKFGKQTDIGIVDCIDREMADGVS